MKDKRIIIMGAELMALFLVFTFLVKFVDVQPSGFGESEIGFARLNMFFKSITPYNEVAYKVSEILGYLGLAVVGFYALVGFISLVKEKDFTKVDIKLYILGFFYVVVGIIYIVFNKVLIINLRPVAGDLEASYPSSHTVLACFVFLSGAKMAEYLFGKNVKILSYVLTATMLILRMISGVHWFTDILGSVLLSSSLLCFFYGICDVQKESRPTE